MERKITLPQSPGIYLLINAVNGYRYVGSGCNLYRRWRTHLYYFRQNKHHNPRLQAAYNKYGEGAFRFSVLELLPLGGCLVSLEQKWLDHFGAAERKDFYNFCAKAYSHLGRKRSDKTRRLLSEAQKGKSPSREARAKMRAAKVGRKLTPGHIAKVIASNKGKARKRHRYYPAISFRNFTPEQIAGMRQLKTEGYSYSQIESLYAVSHGGLQKIIQGKTYRDVQ